MSDNKLIKAIEENDLPKSLTQALVSAFEPFWIQASEIVSEAKNITVSSELDKKSMSKARELRIKLKNIRVSADNQRKELKEESLRTGNAIQGAYNVLKFLIVPMEEYLEKQENYAVLKDKELKCLRLLKN